MTLLDIYDIHTTFSIKVLEDERQKTFIHFSRRKFLSSSFFSLH